MISPKTKLITSIVLLLYGTYLIFDKYGLDVSNMGIIADIITFLIITAALLLIPLIILAVWVGSAYDKLETHNTLYHCENCDKMWRRYQESCPKCSKDRYSKKVDEMYDWMKFNADFLEHDWKQYKQFKKLGKIIQRNDYERRSHEMFMKYWKDNKQ